MRGNHFFFFSYFHFEENQNHLENRRMLQTKKLWRNFFKFLFLTKNESNLSHEIKTNKLFVLSPYLFYHVAEMNEKKMISFYFLKPDD